MSDEQDEKTLRDLRKELAALPDAVTRRNGPIIWAVIHSLAMERDRWKERWQATVKDAQDARDREAALRDGLARLYRGDHENNRHAYCIRPADILALLDGD